MCYYWVVRLGRDLKAAYAGASENPGRPFGRLLMLFWLLRFPEGPSTKRKSTLNHKICFVGTQSSH